MWERKQVVDLQTDKTNVISRADFVIASIRDVTRGRCEGRIIESDQESVPTLSATTTHPGMMSTYSALKLIHSKYSSSVFASTNLPKKETHPLLPLHAYWHLNDTKSLMLASCVVDMVWRGRTMNQNGSSREQHSPTTQSTRAREWGSPWYY